MIEPKDATPVFFLSLLFFFRKKLDFCTIHNNIIIAMIMTIVKFEKKKKTFL